MRRVLVVGALLVALIVGWFVSGPYRTLWSLRAAVEAGDGELVLQHLDVDAVRDDLSEQIGRALTSRVGDGVAGATAKVAAERVAILAAGAALKPEALARTLRWTGAEEAKTSTAWVDASNFELTVYTEASPVVVRLRREGFTWRVVGLKVPPPAPP